MELILIKERAHNTESGWKNEYKCFCGAHFFAKKSNVTSGNTSSCGCLKRKMLIDKNTTHGLIKTNRRLYVIWKAMRKRCSNPNDHNYHHYGGRGISVSVEWNDFTIFHEWATQNGYSDNLTIERIDFNGNYDPANCKWIPLNQQGWNTRTSLGVEKVKQIRHDAALFTTSELSKKYRVDKSTIKRIKNKSVYKIQESCAP